jgi:simple sugar transport system ATP-binding protein
MSEYVIEMKNITKRFPGIVANDNITLELKKGEIHALLGENGAGKSTLMSVLFGLYKQDEGEILLNGEPIEIQNPNDANRYGIGMVHQHFKLVDAFTILDNIILGVEPSKGGFVNRKKAAKTLKQLSQQYELQVDLNSKVMDVSVGMQQRTEILKMLFRENDILIFDEPTAVLTPQEIDQLMITMKNLTNEGKSIIFITHKLDEIMTVCDRVTVLQRGKYIGTVEVKNTTKEELSRMMVGRDVDFHIEKKPQQLKEDILVVKNLTVVSPHTKKHVIDDVSFKVRGGEIVCIAGIDGNGQSELAYAISGLLKPKSGNIYLNGEDIVHKSVRYRNDNGLSHIPEDRHLYGLILNDTLAHNLNLKKYHQEPFQKRGIVNEKEINKFGEVLIDKFDIRSGQGIKTLSGSMSGGNQQKAIIAREIDKQSSLLLSVQTVRGLDVGAVEYAHHQILAERDQGRGVLLISFELDEVMSISDRILVMYEGKIVGDLNPKDISVEELGLYMAGSKRDEIIEEINIPNQEKVMFSALKLTKVPKNSYYRNLYNKQIKRSRGER